MARIGIIITSYNDTHHLKISTYSILKTLKKVDFQIIIVDNGSKKQSMKIFLEKLRGERNIHIILNDNNLGYAKAVNQGISFLQANGTFGYVVVMNQDVQILTNNLEDILKMMDKKPQWGISGPRLFNADGTIQSSAYAFPSIFKKITQLLGFQKFGFYRSKFYPRSIAPLIPSFASNFLVNYAAIKDPIESSWLQGAFLIIKKTVFDDIKGFDEKFQFYAEDMDLCKRAKDKGWDSYYVPQMHVLHYGGLKPKDRSRELTQLYFESLEYYYVKNFRGIRLKIMLFLNSIERWMEMRQLKNKVRLQHG